MFGEIKIGLPFHNISVHQLAFVNCDTQLSLLFSHYLVHFVLSRSSTCMMNKVDHSLSWKQMCAMVFSGGGGGKQMWGANFQSRGQYVVSHPSMNSHLRYLSAWLCRNDNRSVGKYKSSCLLNARPFSPRWRLHNSSGISSVEPWRLGDLHQTTTVNL